MKNLFSIKGKTQKREKEREMVPGVGLEPTHLAAGDFESPASTNFATWAGEEVAIIAAYSGL